MVKSVEAIIKPELLAWARISAGYSEDQAARKAGIKPERLKRWESGKERPTICQLRELSSIYKRPLAVFYLPEPPNDFQPIRDFRRLPGITAGIESPKLRLEIRNAHVRRETALELYKELEDRLPEFSFKARLGDDAENLALHIRRLLGISLEKQREPVTDYDAFNFWRMSLENAGVLVFQAAGIDKSEMRGFSIGKTHLPAIVVNVKDSPLGRVFTMLHELVHIILQDGGLCSDIENETDRPPKEQQVEVFCNRVAGAVLVPKEELIQELVVAQKNQKAEWSPEELSVLARKFRVSREVFLRRLVICGRATNAFYEKMRERFLKEYEEKTSQPKTGFALPHTKAIGYAGKFFVRLALNSYYQEKISASDLSDLLNLRLKHMHKVEKEVIGHTVLFGDYR